MKDEKDLLNDNLPADDSSAKTDDVPVTTAPVEDNDNWKFDGEALTLNNTTIENDEFEIELPVEKPVAKPAPVKVAAAPVKKGKSNALLFSLTAFFVACVIAVIAVFGVRYYTVPNTDEKMNPGNVALTVDDTPVSIGMYNYYYTCISQNYISYASYGYYDIDTSKDYSKQYTTDDNGKKISWANKFVDETVSQIKFITYYYNRAVDAGVTLTSEQKKTVSTQLSSLKTSASENNQSVNEYIQDTYGDYCGYATLKKMLNQCFIAETYYQQISVEEKATDKEINTYFKNHKDDFYEIPFAYLQISYDSSDSKAEAKALATGKEYAAKISTVKDIKKYLPKACKDTIDSYVSAGYFTSASEAAKTLSENVTTTITKNEDSLTSDAVDWLFADSTKVGDCTAIDDKDNSTVFILLKTGEPQLMDDEVYSVRHILITPGSDDDDSSTTDDSTTTKTYTKAEWAAAKKEAEKILKEYNSGDKTEYSFALLAEKYSDDTESTSSGSSGLYGGLYAGTELGSMVSSFEKWATDKSRKYGDVGIVKSTYGYHIMYFVEDTQEYKYECANDVIEQKENDATNNVTVKRHEKAMSKTKKAKPEASTSSDSTTSSAQ